MTEHVREIISKIYKAYADMEKAGYDPEKQSITLSHDTIFALISCLESMDDELECLIDDCD